MKGIVLHNEITGFQIIWLMLLDDSHGEKAIRISHNWMASRYRLSKTSLFNALIIKAAIEAGIKACQSDYASRIIPKSDVIASIIILYIIPFTWSAPKHSSLLFFHVAMATT